MRFSVTDEKQSFNNPHLYSIQPIFFRNTLTEEDSTAHSGSLFHNLTIILKLKKFCHVVVDSFVLSISVGASSIWAYRNPNRKN